MDTLTAAAKIQELYNDTDFRLSYLLKVGKPLDSVEQFVQSIEDGDITTEDVFFNHIDTIGLDYKLSVFWDDNAEYFDMENYHPSEKKLPSGGAWIRIRTENGYELHYARVSNRKRRFSEERLKIHKSMNFQQEKIISRLKMNFNADAGELKMKELEKEANILSIYLAINLPLYEVRIQKTKTQVKYFNPFQYEIASDDDITMITDAILEKCVGLKMVNLYTSINEDQIFYMRSRGIPEDLAILMSNMKQCYFKVDLDTMMNEYNKQFSVKIIKHNDDD